MDPLNSLEADLNLMEASSTSMDLDAMEAELEGVHPAPRSCRRRLVAGPRHDRSILTRVAQSRLERQAERRSAAGRAAAHIDARAGRDAGAGQGSSFPSKKSLAPGSSSVITSDLRASPTHQKELNCNVRTQVTPRPGATPRDPADAAALQTALRQLAQAQAQVEQQRGAPTLPAPRAARQQPGVARAPSWMARVSHLTM
jgi:hypothetical protein